MFQLILRAKHRERKENYYFVINKLHENKGKTVCLVYA